MKNNKLAINLLLCFGLFLPPFAQGAQPETPEIVFNGSEALPLREKAGELDNAVAIYEYIRNTFEFVPYHGSRSGSVNTFLGQRGNDVDIATAMIAMMRSQNIPARYAVATVRIPNTELNNWLGTKNINVAVQVLKDQGIQGVVLDSVKQTVDFEHVWAEVKIPFEQYRGLPTNPPVDCSLPANDSRCGWLPLDGSFKQKAYNGLNIDPYSSVVFDYTAYYNAIKNKATKPELVDKNPLTILEEQVAGWLRVKYPGKTLEDVADPGQVIEVHDGLLPASLPYQVVDTVRQYDSVAAHDEGVKAAPKTEPKEWGKLLKIYVNVVESGIKFQTKLAQVLLAKLNTKPLTLTTEYGKDAEGKRIISTLATKLGGTVITTHIKDGKTLFGEGSISVSDFAPLIIMLEMDGAPDSSGGANDQKITATYSGIIGGYYLIATGGESSNWSQVHRAADKLLEANTDNKVVFKPGEPGCDAASGLNCTPYVDATNNGWDISDLPLLEDKPALDALTGGLLYVAATQYFAKQREHFDRADHLMKTKTSIIGFLGIVSTDDKAEYIDGTAFSILPGGLLIDMKGITIGGSYRVSDNTYSNSQFELLGHITSSLEHEIWQELTGYDAVSTVRGIQMALAKGDELLNPIYKSADIDTLPGLYTKFGFTSTVPSGFVDASFTTFSPKPSLWTHGILGASFDMFLPRINDTYSDILQAVVRYKYSKDYGMTDAGVIGGSIYGWTNCVSELIKKLNAIDDGLSASFVTCNFKSYGYTPKSIALDIIKSEWKDTIIPIKIGQQYFDYFDKAKGGFSTANKIYQSYPPEKGEYEAYPIAFIRSDLYDRDVSKSWVEYWLPSRLVSAPNNYFSVDIRKQYETASGRLISMFFEIQNLGGK